MVDEVDLGREFFTMLEQHDEGVARRVAVEGCPRCDGPLHRGDYDRKPRGALIAPASALAAAELAYSTANPSSPTRRRR